MGFIRKEKIGLLVMGLLLVIWLAAYLAYNFAPGVWAQFEPFILYTFLGVFLIGVVVVFFNFRKSLDLDWNPDSIRLRKDVVAEFADVPRDESLLVGEANKRARIVLSFKVVAAMLLAVLAGYFYFVGPWYLVLVCLAAAAVLGRIGLQSQEYVKDPSAGMESFELYRDKLVLNPGRQEVQFKDITELTLRSYPDTTETDLVLQFLPGFKYNYQLQVTLDGKTYEFYNLSTNRSLWINFKNTLIPAILPMLGFSARSSISTIKGSAWPGPQWNVRYRYEKKTP